MAQIKAKPTEWHGVVYRSKSEAMMAAYLNRAGFSLEYEPETLQLEDGTAKYVPDFCVYDRCDEVCCTPGRQLLYLPDVWFIEYKPSQVTSTYLAQLIDNFKRILLHPFWLEYGSAWGNVRCVLMVGSFWKNDGHTTTLCECATDDDVVWARFDGWFLRGCSGGYPFGYPKEMKDMRFDLEQKG